MGAQSGLGEFEQLVLLAIIRLGPNAHAPRIAALLEEAADRNVSRGALYSALDRLERKKFLTWTVVGGDDQSRGHPKRRFSVAEPGLVALRRYRAALTNLWAGLDDELAPTGGAR